MDGEDEAQARRLREQLDQARAEVRARLHLVGADGLETLQAIEREVERIGLPLRESSRDAMALAIFRLRQISASVDAMAASA